MRRTAHSLLMALLGLAAATATSGPQLKVASCDERRMVVRVPLPGPTAAAFLPQLRYFPEAQCQPQLSADGQVAEFSLPLDDWFVCGVTRVLHRASGVRTFLAKLAVEATPGAEQQLLTAKCVLPTAADAEADADGGSNRTRRNVLPAGFQEEEVLEIRPKEKLVPAPQLGVAVRQGGRAVTGELNVNPGTALQMEVFLDEQAAPIYGLLVAHMAVSDTRSQEETIIFNGCSVDPYLFENFNTVDGDFLSAKFRAFKFPESTFVQFKGTVSVCLDRCRGVECSNGAVGHGRRRRAVAELPADPNKVFDVSFTSFLKVQYADQEAENMEKALLAASSDAPVAATQVVPEGDADSNAIPPAPGANSGLEVAKEELPGFTVQQSPAGASGAASAAALPLLALTAVVVNLFR